MGMRMGQVMRGRDEEDSRGDVIEDRNGNKDNGNGKRMLLVMGRRWEDR